jgi:phosphatidate cytidylyltransferase
LLLAPKYGSRFSAVLSGFLVLVPAAIGLARLVIVEPNGNWLLLYLLVLIAAADVGGYFGGKTFGRHKLAPAISPGKTWEGFAAGMLASVLVAVVSASLFRQPVFAWVALGLLVALVSVVGDLVESLFKRRVGLKDSSGLLPGHGGVLDRIDSHTAAAPVFLLGLHALGVPA